MNYCQNITRIQLKGYGLSYYQSQVITRNINPINKEKNLNIYLLSEVILSTKEYLVNPKITEKTRKSLSSLLPKLIQQLDNTIPTIFSGSTDSELNQLSKKLFTQLTKTEKDLIKAKSRIAAIKGKYKE